MLFVVLGSRNSAALPEYKLPMLPSFPLIWVVLAEGGQGLQACPGQPWGATGSWTGIYYIVPHIHDPESSCAGHTTDTLHHAHAPPHVYPPPPSCGAHQPPPPLVPLVSKTPGVFDTFRGVFGTLYPPCNLPPLQSPPPPQGGGVTAIWPKKHGKYWAPKAPKKIFTRHQRRRS